jgi:hypothetical protein
METITIVDEKLKQDKNGDDYANVKLADGRYVNLMFDNFTAYDGLGDYQAEITKNGKFWKMAPGTLTKVGESSPEAQETPKTPPQATPSAKDKLRHQYSQAETTRSILLQVIIKASAEAYSGCPGTLVQEDVLALADKYLLWAEKHAQNTIEEVPF